MSRARYKMTDGEKEQVAKIYQYTKSISAINRAYGFSKRSRVVKKALQGMGVDILVGRRKIPESQEQEIIDRYLAGESSCHISTEYNVTYPAICDLLKRNQIERRDNRALTDKQEAQATKEYLDGKTLEAVAEQFGIAVSSVPNIIHRQGCETRPAGHNSRQYNLNENFFDDLNNELVAYILGFIYADGSIHRETLHIALSIKDLKYLELIRGVINYDAPIQFYKVETPQKKLKEACRLSVHSKIISKQLENLGVVKNRGKFCKLESKLPKEMYRHFIRGFVDGDGCLDSYKRNNARLRILGQDDILTWIASIFKDHLDLPERKLRNRGNILELEYNGARQARTAITWLYKDANIYLGRKIGRMKWFNE